VIRPTGPLADVADCCLFLAAFRLAALCQQQALAEADTLGQRPFTRPTTPVDGSVRGENVSTCERSGARGSGYFLHLLHFGFTKSYNMIRFRRPFTWIHPSDPRRGGRVRRWSQLLRQKTCMHRLTILRSRARTRSSCPPSRPS
jgi:hypothetical protein